MEDSTKRILELCESKRIPRAKMCRDCNIPPTTISNYVKRGDKPPYEILKKVSSYFGVSIGYLETGVESTFNLEGEVREILERISALPEKKQEAFLSLIYKMLNTYEE